MTIPSDPGTTEAPGLSGLEQLQAAFTSGVISAAAALQRLYRVSTVWFEGPFAITQLFGCTGVEREPPKGGCPHFHSGVDVGASYGARVLAGVEGTIKQVGYDPRGYGNYVVIAPRNSPGYQILIGHLKDTTFRAHTWTFQDPFGQTEWIKSKIGTDALIGPFAPRALKAGDTVHVGDELGHVGSTGNSSGPHLHFEVDQITQSGLTPVDPTRWLARGDGADSSSATPPIPFTGPDTSGLAGIGTSLGAIAGVVGALGKPKTWFIVLGVLMMAGGVIVYVAHKEERQVIAAALPKEA